MQASHEALAHDKTLLAIASPGLHCLMCPWALYLEHISRPSPSPSVLWTMQELSLAS